MIQRFPVKWVFLSMMVGFLMIGGCKNKVAKEVAAMNDSNIKRISNLYAAFQNYKGGRGPTDETELKTFIKEFDKEKLPLMGIDPGNVDAIFVSERDGEPFKIRYRVGGGRGSVDPVVYEQEGKGGKKQVGFTGGKVEDVDEATYQQLLAGKVGAPAPGAPPGAPGAASTPGRTSGRPTGAPMGPPGK